MDLDVASPEEVADVLREAADQYREDGLELASAHQDELAAAPWNLVAAELDAAAGRIGNKLAEWWG